MTESSVHVNIDLASLLTSALVLYNSHLTMRNGRDIKTVKQEQKDVKEALGVTNRRGDNN